MERTDPFDKIGAEFLLADADLLLTIVRVAQCHRSFNDRIRAIERAKASFRRLCELVCMVRTSARALTQLGEKLNAIRIAMNQRDPVRP